VERPKKLSGEQGKYIEYLEGKLEKFSSKKTGIRGYLALKKIIDDTANIVSKGLEVENQTSPGNMIHVDVISEMALTSKDDKTFDRLFKFIDKIGHYTNELSAMEEKFTEEEIKRESELLKGDFSVENIMMNNG
jgi:hypothetical protein